VAAGPVGGCWKQTPAWSTTAWTANTWAGATVVTTTTVLPGGGSVGRGTWSARGKTRFRDGKPVVEPTPLRKPPEPTTRPVASHTPVLEPPPEIKAPTPQSFALEPPVETRADIVPTIDPVQQQRLQAAVRAEQERQRQEADDQAAIEALLKLL